MPKFFIANNKFEKEEVEGIIKTFKECPNEQWGFRKINDHLWNVTHIRSGLEAVHGKTQAVCTKNLKNLFKSEKVLEHIKNMKSIDETIEQVKTDYENRTLKNKRFMELREEFKQITGITCPVDCIVGGVDIIKLDEIIGTPDGISLSDYLKNEYGNRASEIINEMVS